MSKFISPDTHRWRATEYADLQKHIQDHYKSFFSYDCENTNLPDSKGDSLPVIPGNYGQKWIFKSIIKNFFIVILIAYYLR